MTRPVIAGDIRNGAWPTHTDEITIEFINLYEERGKPERTKGLRRVRVAVVDPATQAQPCVD